MATAKKLPSGNWRALVFIGKDAKGKRQYKSFTADSKREAEYLAAEFTRRKGEQKNPMNITLGEAITRYIAAKGNTLSPNTVRNYSGYQKNNFQELQSVQLKNLTNEKIQQAISFESIRLAPKTIANNVGLISAALKMFWRDFRLDVTLPQKIKREATVPTTRQVKELLALAAGTDVELPIMLAAMGGLREGEIAALTVADIRKDGVLVSKDIARDENGEYVLKGTPKTEAGNRVAPLPPQVMKKIRVHAKGKSAEESLFGMMPHIIYKHYAKLRDQCGMERCRFHDLRHYYASFAHAIGVPDEYIMRNGGWKDRSTLQNVYEHPLSDHEVSENKRLAERQGELFPK